MSFLFLSYIFIITVFVTSTVSTLSNKTTIFKKLIQNQYLH